MAHDVPSYALTVLLSLDPLEDHVQIDGDVDVDFDEFADVLTDEAAMRVFDAIQTGDVEWGEEVQVEFAIEATNVLRPV